MLESKSGTTRPDTPAKAVSSPERVASSITKGVLRRHYVVGQRLIESDLTQQLGVSRSTVREALKILAANGVVELVPHRGAVIRGLSLTDAEKLLALLEVLTGLAARLAADNIDRGQNRKLFMAAAKPLIDARSTNELDRILDERARYYQTMLDIADNSELRRAMPMPRAHLFRTQFYGFLSKVDLRAMVTEYRNITKAILAGSGAKAELYARRHLQRTAERTLPHLR
ncbi:MAG: GntR family transcriptional regulator [Rhizobacter sp.]|nr:GntR family transcriptional regulator [Rhizobacter sp.]